MDFCKCFREMYCLHLQDSSSRGVTTKNNIDFFTFLTASDLHLQFVFLKGEITDHIHTNNWKNYYYMEPGV